jgi:hypothetical protein
VNEDILQAIVVYLRAAMDEDLGGIGFLGVWADYAPSVPDGVPYAIVHDGPETYTEESSSGGTNIISDGLVQVSFIAATKAEVRYLARRCVRLLIDTVVTLEADDGEIIYLRPLRTDSTMITEIGPGIPTAFKRVVTIRYRQQWTSP